MSDIDLDALEATARAATPGPWHQGAHYIGAGGEPHDPETHVGQASVLQDAEHIAAFDPPTVLALIARLREAEAAIEAVAGRTRIALSKLDSYSWHRHDTHFVRSTREDLAVVHDTIARYMTTETEGNRDEF